MQEKTYENSVLRRDKLERESRFVTPGKIIKRRSFLVKYGL